MNSTTSEKKQKAPGCNEREEITIMDAVRMFDTADGIEAWFLERCWPNGVQCPHYGSKNGADVKRRKPQP